MKDFWPVLFVSNLILYYTIQSVSMLCTKHRNAETQSKTKLQSIHCFWLGMFCCMDRGLIFSNRLIDFLYTLVMVCWVSHDLFPPPRLKKVFDVPGHNGCVLMNLENEIQNLFTNSTKSVIAYEVPDLRMYPKGSWVSGCLFSFMMLSVVVRKCSH
jgi:hypothetical protein